MASLKGVMLGMDLRVHISLFEGCQSPLLLFEKQISIFFLFLLRDLYRQKNKKKVKCEIKKEMKQ